MKRVILLLFIALLGAVPAFPQTSVSISPPIYLQFLDSTGKPLAGGFLFTYQAGTSTLQPTYTDSTGTIQNADPIPLDATGVPSNSSGAQTGVWLANQSYKMCTYNSAMVLQRCVDNVTGYLQILNQANTWTFAQTFTQPIVDTATDSQLVFGASGSQTTLDLPPPSGNITLHTPSTSDTLVGRNTTDTLANKTLNSPVLANATGSLTNPVLSGVNAQTGTTYTVVATDEQRLVTFSNAAAVAVTLPIASTTGFTAGTKFSFKNLGAGVVTITPTASTIDGAASLSLNQTQGVDVYSDGTNYWTQGGSSQSIKVTQIDLTAQGAGITGRTILTPSANGFYRVTAYAVITQAATTSSTLGPISLGYTDADSGVGETPFLTVSNGGNALGGIVSSAGANNSTPWGFYAKAGSAITFSITYASSGATPMQYAIHLRMEGPF